MGAKSRARRQGRRERGAVLATVGIFMIVLVGMAVLGVDVGRLALTANETQVAVDAGAVAYAKTMLDNEVQERSDNPLVAAHRVVRQNHIAGRPALSAGIQYAVGRFDFENTSFRPGGFPTNAVRAEGTANIDNIFAGALGDPSSSVTRSAVAAFGGAGAARPTLPVALGDCYFDRYQRSDNCSDLPKLQQVPEGDENSCWTSLGPTDANASSVIDILPTECCSGGSGSSCGGSRVTDPVSVGDGINVLNGSSTTILQILENCIEQGITEFLMPIVECGKCNQLADVIGFATVRLLAAHASGADKGVELEAICATTDVTGGGAGQGGNFGTMTLSLVE